ncbi:MAG TPA: CaiB/BaiF CoA-transferase family protein [Steroidobacteraceae bacterium]|nr:CaiB/BaiF CoA-transferase family protein [Steroidobacteraceae bacterium]
MPGPLQGLKVVEMVGIGPGPFCAMLLADMGAEVIRIDRHSGKTRMEPRFDVLARGRKSIALDLKNPAAVEVALELISKADALIEGFRPGVMERLGLGPEICLQRNPRLVYGRMTGWGQTGPLAQAAGHDLNYIALSGMLHAIGRADSPPPPPLNLIGDFGGGAMLLAFGLVCALLETKHSHRGQVVDAAMTDGSALLGSLMYGLKAAGRWGPTRGANLLDGGAHFYDTYECADGKYIALAAIEPAFYAEVLKLIGLEDAAFQRQMDVKAWPELKQTMAARIKTKSRAEWCSVLEGTDACFAPVLDLDEAPDHAHNRARHAFMEVEGVVQPAPAPRFSRTPGAVSSAPAEVGAHSEEILRDWGFNANAVAQLKAASVI